MRGRIRFVSCSAASVPDISNEILLQLNEETADEELGPLLTGHLCNLLPAAELQAVQAKILRVCVLRLCVCRVRLSVSSFILYSVPRNTKGKV